jgi:hypothetical protein
MLCIPRSSGLSMPECHNILPCPRPPRPPTEPDVQISRIRLFDPPPKTPADKDPPVRGASSLPTDPEHTRRWKRARPVARASSSCWQIHLRVWATPPGLCSTSRRPLRVGPTEAVPRRALPRLRLYYEPVRRPYLDGPALPLQLVGADKRYGPPKFRCNPLDGPLWPATPACRRRLAW